MTGLGLVMTTGWITGWATGAGTGSGLGVRLGVGTGAGFKMGAAGGSTGGLTVPSQNEVRASAPAQLREKCTWSRCRRVTLHTASDTDLQPACT